MLLLIDNNAIKLLIVKHIVLLLAPYVTVVIMDLIIFVIKLYKIANHKMEMNAINVKMAILYRIKNV